MAHDNGPVNVRKMVLARSPIAGDASSMKTEHLPAGERAAALTTLVRQRRATSAFSSSDVDEDDLALILMAGLEAPSSYNLQPWRFIVVRTSEQRQRLRVAAMNQEQVSEAPVVIVACGDTLGWPEDLESIIEIGRAHGFGDETSIARKRSNVTAQFRSHPNMPMWVAKQTMIAATTMMWTAEALGYDTGPMEGFYEDRVQAVLEIPPHVCVLFLLAIGRRAGEEGRYPGRLPTARTVFCESYGRHGRIGALVESRRIRA
jgi:nitroreductase